MQLRYTCTRIETMPAFLPFLCSIFLNPFSQQEITAYRSFTIDNREVVWSQIYHEDTLSASDLSVRLFNDLKRKTWLINLQYEGTDIVADIHRMRIAYKKYGGKFRNTSTILRTGLWYGKLRISFRDGKYRVIVYGLNYIAQQPATGSGKVTMEAHEISGTLSEWVLNNYNTSFRKSRFTNLDIIHTSLNDNFTLHENQLIDSDW